jgi:hypothetical protein
MKKLIFLLAAVLLSSAQLYSQWVNVPNGLSTNKIFWTLASSGNNVFAGNNNGVYISTNDGTSWSLTSLDKPGFSLLADGVNLYAGTIHGVYLSTNNGNNWTQLVVTTYSVWGLAKNGDNIFAGTNGNGVYRSTNNGQNWEQTSLSTNKVVSSMAVIENNVFAGDWTSPTVWVSTDNGINWIVTYLGGEYPRVVLSLAAKGSNIYAGTDNDGIFISSNNGLNWMKSGLNIASINSIIINGNNVFAGVIIYPPGGVILSTDNGFNWINKNQGLEEGNVWSITTNSQYIFACTDNSVWRRSLAEIVGVQNISSEVPSAYSLKQNYPNPFNPTTKIKFDVGSVKQASLLVTLKVFDVMGREVQTLVNERLNPGTYETTFDGSMLPSGVYFYKLITEGFTETKRMTLIK